MSKKRKSWNEEKTDSHMGAGLETLTIVKEKEREPEKRGDVFDSGLKVLKNIDVQVPYCIKMVCNEIQSQFPNKEFSILCKGKITADGFKISDEYIIPYQEVDVANVDFDQREVTKLKGQGWNTIIHSHHEMGLDRFSGSDMQTINRNFKCSILYNKHEFVFGILNLPLEPGMLYQLEPRINVEGRIDTSMIRARY